VRADRQDRISEFETETAGYTLVNANLGYRLIVGNVVYDLLLRGNNLTDELALNHVSFLKDVAPLPGRDVSLALKVSF
jgi:iron complex outermembrane recepter protein